MNIDEGIIDLIYFGAILLCLGTLFSVLVKNLLSSFVNRAIAIFLLLKSNDFLIAFKHVSKVEYFTSIGLIGGVFVTHGIAEADIRDNFFLALDVIFLRSGSFSVRLSWIWTFTYGVYHTEAV